MKIIYCTECGERYEKQDDTTYKCANDHYFWNNPKATVAVIMYNDKHELLYSKRANEPAKGLYDFPGGFCEFNENPFEAANREIDEETGMKIDELELIGAYSDVYSENESVCDLIILVRKFEGTPVPDDDSEALEWKPIDFMEDEQFNPNYPGLGDKLRKLL